MPESWTRRLIFQAYGMIIGVVCGKLWLLSESQIPFAYALFVILTGVSLFAFVSSRRGRLPVWAACLLFGLGAVFLGWGRYTQKALVVNDPAHVSNLVASSWNEASVVEGRIVSDPEIVEDVVTMEILPERVQTRPKEEMVACSGGRVIVSIRDSAGDLYEQFGGSDVYGWRIRVRAPLLAPPGSANPDAFSYRDFLESRGIYASQYISFDWGNPPAIEVLERSEGLWMIEWALIIKEKLLQVFRQTVPYPESAFLGGVTLGLRAGLKYTKVEGHPLLITQEFKIAGVSHVLAVSGLHVTIIAGMFFAIFSALRIPLRIQTPLIIFFLIIFMIITGAAPATQRATIMNSLILLFLALSKGGFRSSLLFGIAEAAFVILLVNPLNIVQPAFTLSFAAVLALGLISWPIERVLGRLQGPSFVWFIAVNIAVAWQMTVAWDLFFSPARFYPFLALVAVTGVMAARLARNGLWEGFAYRRMPAFLRSFVSAQGAIQLGMMIPLSAYYFGQFAVGGAYANFIAIPLIGVIVPLGIIGGLLGLIPGAGTILALILGATNWVLIKLFLMTAYVTTLIFPYPFVRNWTLGQLGVFYAALALFIWHEPLIRVFKELYTRHYKYADDPALKVPRAAAALTCVALIVMLAAKLVARPADLPDGHLRVTFLSTRFGNSAVIEAPGGKTFVVDGGAGNAESHFDVGERVVAPYLLKRGKKRIDGLILTNLAPSHTEGAGAIAEGFDVGKVYDVAPIKSFDALIAADAKDPEKAYLAFLRRINDPNLLDNRNQNWVRRYYNAYLRIARGAGGRGIERVKIQPGVLALDERVNGLPLRIEFFGPAGNRRDARDLSGVMKLEYGTFSMLFTGAITSAAQDELAEKFSKRLQSDVYVIPNHAMTPDSRHAPFLHVVRPTHAIFQAGSYKAILGNDFAARTRDKEARENFDATRAWFEGIIKPKNVLDPYRDLAVVVETDGTGYRVKTYREMSGAISEEELDKHKDGPQ